MKRTSIKHLLGVVVLALGVGSCQQELDLRQPDVKQAPDVSEVAVLKAPANPEVAAALDGLRVPKNLSRIPYADGQPLTTPTIKYGEMGAAPSLMPNPNRPDRPIEGVRIYRDRKITEKLAYNEHRVYADELARLYPGLVLKGEEVARGNFGTVDTYTLNPVTISTTLIPDFGGDPAGLAPITFDQQTPETRLNIGTYRQALKTWGATSPVESYVSTASEIIEVEVDHSGNISTDVDINAGLKFQLKLGVDVAKRKSHVMLKFVQKAFTVSMDKPDVNILSSIDPSQLNGYMPVYVSDIHYGRAMYAVFSSDELTTDVSLAVNAIRQGLFGTSAGGGGAVAYSHLLNDCAVTFFMIGGNQQDHGQAVNGWTFAKRYMQKGINMVNAAPIAYTLAFVDDNSIARTIYAGERPSQEAYFVPKFKNIEIGTQLVGIKARRAGSLIGTLHSQVYGTVQVKLPGLLVGKYRSNLFVDRSRPVHVRNTGDFVDISRYTSKYLMTVTTPKITSYFNDFFNDAEVEIYVDLYAKGLGSRRTDTHLGTGIVKLPLKEYLFSSVDGELIVDINSAHGGILSHFASVKLKLDRFEVRD